MSAYDERIRRIRRKYLKYLDRGSRVLDLGCGDGAFMKFLREEGFAVVGVDRDGDAVRRAADRQLTVEEKDFLEFLRENQGGFGGIICSHVMEHIPIEQCEAFIRLCYGALTSKGVIVIITPNVHTLAGAADFWNDPSHVRPFPPASLKRLLTGAGFEVIDQGFDHDTRPALRKDGLHLPLDVLRSVMGRLCYGRAAPFSEVFAVAQKVPGASARQGRRA
jgi:SAM-dependent methyltransferase